MKIISNFFKDLYESHKLNLWWYWLALGCAFFVYLFFGNHLSSAPKYTTLRLNDEWKYWSNLKTIYFIAGSLFYGGFGVFLYLVPIKQEIVKEIIEAYTRETKTLEKQLAKKEKEYTKLEKIQYSIKQSVLDDLESKKRRLQMQIENIEQREIQLGSDFKGLKRLEKKIKEERRNLDKRQKNICGMLTRLKRKTMI